MNVESRSSVWGLSGEQRVLGVNESSRGNLKAGHNQWIFNAAALCTETNTGSIHTLWDVCASDVRTPSKGKRSSVTIIEFQTTPWQQSPATFRKWRKEKQAARLTGEECLTSSVLGVVSYEECLRSSVLGVVSYEECLRSSVLGVVSYEECLRSSVLRGVSYE